MSVLCFMDPFFRAGVPQDYKGAQPCLPYHAMSEIAARSALKVRVERDDAKERGCDMPMEKCPVCNGEGWRMEISEPWGGYLLCHICRGTGRYTR